jgi:hypothetical protein
MHGRRALLTGVLLVLVLGAGQLWLGAKNPVDHPQATASSTTPEAGDSSSGPAISPSAVASDVSDGEHFALLLRSGQGVITVKLINLLTGTEALQACRRDLGQVRRKAVCGVYYFTNNESRIRVLPVSTKASIDYVSSLRSDRYTLGHLSGADVDSSARVSKRNQQGKLFDLTVIGGVVDTVTPVPPLCKDIEGKNLDTRTKWTSKCILREQG